jgi:hypothetical protein
MDVRHDSVTANLACVWTGQDTLIVGLVGVIRRPSTINILFNPKSGLCIIDQN